MRDAARNEGAAGLAVGMATGQGLAGQVPPGPLAAPTAPAPAAEDADVAALQKLKRMYEADLIDEAEYKAKKADILGRM